MTPTPVPVLPSQWTRLLTDSPDLATALVDPDYRLWSDADPRGDALRGPADLAEYAGTRQNWNPGRVRPRIAATSDRRIAFSWDLTRPDGSTITGIDVHDLAGDGRIARSWSIVGERADILVTPTATPVPAAALQRGCARWTDMWNGEIDLLPELVTDDFRIWFGTLRSADDSVEGPGGMAAYVRAFRTQLDGVRFREDGAFVLDPEEGRAAVLWTVTLPPAARPAGVPGDGPFDLGGVDLFQFSGDRISRVWSITGMRPNDLERT